MCRIAAHTVFSKTVLIAVYSHLKRRKAFCRMKCGSLNLKHKFKAGWTITQFFKKV